MTHIALFKSKEPEPVNSPLRNAMEAVDLDDPIDIAFKKELTADCFDYSSIPCDLIISGLLKQLPSAVAEWSEEGRERWLSVLKSSFDVIYKAAKK